jgi:histidyl-tRNA synthetase
MTNIKTELYLGDVKPKKVFSYAEKRGHQFAVILGADEIAKNEIQFKNLITRENTEYIEEWTRIVQKYIQKKIDSEIQENYKKVFGIKERFIEPCQ